MPGRHQLAPSLRAGRSRLRWLAGAFMAVVLAGAAVLGFAFSAAGATDPVGATFGVTGVSTTNCPVSIGGSNVYIKPGQELDIKSSLAGIIVEGQGALSDLLGSVASLDGALTIDPKATKPTKVDISTKAQKITGLSAGDHDFTWTVSSVKLLLGLIPIPLQLTSSEASAGASLTYTGAIHVTNAAANCGIAVQVPSTHISASVKGLPPLNIGIPGVKLTVPVSVPSLGLGNHSSSAPANGGGTSTHAGTTPVDDQAGALPVPAGIVPIGNAGGGGGGFNALPLPGVLNNLGSSSAQLPGASNVDASGKTTGPDARQKSVGNNKSINLAASKSSTGQLSVVLAIIAVIALTLVAATYARLYVMRKP